MSHLPSLTGMTSFRGLLPSSPTKLPTGLPESQSGDEVKAVWQRADVGDGRGRGPLLLLSTPTHALQVFALRDSVIPDQPHVPETFPSPQEVLSVARIRYDSRTIHSRLSGIDVFTTENGAGREIVLSMRLIEGAKISMVILTTLRPASRKSTLGALALVLLDLQTGVAVRRIELGIGSAAAVHVSPRVIAITVSHPTPTIHLLHPATFEPLPLSPITSLPCNPSTALPILSLSGRLIAFATSEPPAITGADGLGSIVTASSTRAAAPRSAPAFTQGDQRSSSSTGNVQGALLTSAIEIGGGVAKGVWAGLKMGAQAAHRARNTRLARSAPTDTSSALADEESEGGMETESRSLDDSSVFEDQVMPETPVGGEWIKVLDVFARGLGHDPATGSDRRFPKNANGESQSNAVHPDERESQALRIIAHFRLPTAALVMPAEASGARALSTKDRGRSVSYLSFNPEGTKLLAAAAHGRVSHVLDLHPVGFDRNGLRGAIQGQVWHLYELRRGHTTASVKHVEWDTSGRFVGVSTDRGTVHVFPINTTGGPASASTHATMSNGNPIQLYALSTVLNPIARFRPCRLASEDGTVSPSLSVSHDEATFGFSPIRRHGLDTSVYYQDISIFRGSSAGLETARITLRPQAQPDDQELPSNTGPASSALHRRGSALTEMMRDKAFGRQGGLGVGTQVLAAWSLPPGTDEDVLTSRPVGEKPQKVNRRDPSRSLARAEIRTHSDSTRLLPSSIYLSRQVDFFVARPIDDFSPLSMLDVEARQGRLVFRQEVEARPSLAEVKSFDEPILSAMHAVIEKRPQPQIPGLPNGQPGTRRWPSSIPIRNVTAGLNEGVGRVRREYARAQRVRSKRRGAAGVEQGLSSLSFEEDSVLASLSSDEAESSPSSAALPTTNTDPSEDDEWSAEWEEEYRKAVEDDGPPDELVLGLMDEEEEERRKWELRREKLRKEYARA
ncbi:hypothetical protein IAU60_005719 [Kwoniella sp. DSM 27419]